MPRTYVRRYYRRRTEPEKPPNKFMVAIITTYDEVNRRMWAQGRSGEWSDADTELGRRILCHLLRRLGSYYPELADRLDEIGRADAAGELAMQAVRKAAQVSPSPPDALPSAVKRSGRTGLPIP